MSENMREILMDLRRVIVEITMIQEQRLKAQRVNNFFRIEELEGDLKKMEGRRNALVALARLRNISPEEIKEALYG
jgi:hypothetical protein